MEINYEKLKKEAPGMGIKMIVLFGSQASGKAKKESDYDVAVLMMEKRNIKESLAIYTETLFFLAEALRIPSEKLDLTNLNSASPFLQNEIFTEGKLIFGSEYEFAGLKSFAMREYISTKDLRELRSKIISRRQVILAEKIYD